ncbi:hypothetical protein CHELA1G2_12573 [Hyphomicrobiales bacterium]|nr:hypothetical protein CHELA1G2_12573 [Hyphomicrobiales bacterium]
MGSDAPILRIWRFGPDAVACLAAPGTGCGPLTHAALSTP